jgi:hypothetical protein
VLLERLNTDRSIAHLVAQFVPLKIDTGTNDWGSWAQKYPHEGNGIPIVYVVRADGELLFGRTGALRGPELGAMMTIALQRAGRVLTEQQIAVVEEAANKAQQAVGDGDHSQAVQALLAVRKVGTIGQLGSNAAAALKCDELVGELTELGKTVLTDMDQAFGSGELDLNLALSYLEAKRTYQPLPTLKTELATLSRKYERRPDVRDLLRQARPLDEILRKADEEPDKATEALKKLISASPDSPAAEIALARLNQMHDVVLLPQDDEQEIIARTWTDRSGHNRIQAVLVGIQTDYVVLRRGDGRTVNVPLDKLSGQDQIFVKFMRLRFESNQPDSDETDAPAETPPETSS